MKKYFYKFVTKSFAKNVVTIPPKLKSKNSQKESKKKISPIYNLLKSEKLAGSNNEKLNIEEKMDYETIVTEASKLMLINYFKIYENKTVKEKELSNLCEYIEKVLNPSEISSFIKALEEAKKIINSESVEKTEEVFKLFIDKLYNLSTNKAMTKTLINLISKISLKELSGEEIFRFSNKGVGNDLNSMKKEKSDGQNLQRSIYYSQIESNFNKILNIRNPVTNDIDKPETDFKDSFMMKHEYAFKEKILFQRNSKATKFDFSNYVFFYGLPLFYPVEDKDTKKVMIKHLNNEILLKNEMIKLQSLKKFSEKYLTRALEEGLCHSSKLEGELSTRRNIKVQIMNSFSFLNKENDYYDFNLVNESMDFVNEMFESTEESRDPSMRKISKYRTYNRSKIQDLDENDLFYMDKLISNTRYLELRKAEVEGELKKNINNSIYWNGLLLFNNYEEKKHFLKSGAGIFGVHLQGKCVRFFDADFCNILMFRAADDIQLDELKRAINIYFTIKEQKHLLLDSPDYFNEITKMTVNQNSSNFTNKVFIRFNSFLNALKAYEILNEVSIKSLVSFIIKWGNIVLKINLFIFLHFYLDSFMSLHKTKYQIL